MDPDSDTNWEAYDDPTCIMIEDAFQRFLKQKSLKKEDRQLVISGGYSIDLKFMVQF